MSNVVRCLRSKLVIILAAEQAVNHAQNLGLSCISLHVMKTVIFAVQTHSLNTYYDYHTHKILAHAQLAVLIVQACKQPHLILLPLT